MVESGRGARTPIPEDLRRLLLDLARRSLTRFVEAGERIAPPSGIALLAETHGVFVSLHRGGELRGCIGYPAARDPLGQTVVDCAIAAASEDPRFPPVSAGELADVHVEVSVLTEPEPCLAEDVVVGEHGLIVSQGSRRGLLLPQVASERGWDRETFLAQACRKAGLPADAWQHGARLQRFAAEVFGED